MNTPTDTRHHTASTTDPPPEAPRDRRPPTRRYTTAGLLALGAVLFAAVWAAAALWSLSDQVDDLARTDIPGEVVVTVDEPGGQIVYYERTTWLASLPMNPDLAIDVTGPDGQAVPTNPYDLAVRYRLPGLIGEPVGTFDAKSPGDYTVTFQGSEPLPDDARTAIGPSITTGILTGLAGPIILLFAGLVAAAVIAILAANSRSNQPAGTR